MRHGLLIVGLSGGLVSCLGTTGPATVPTYAVVTGQIFRPDGTTPVPDPAISIQLLSATVNGTSTLIGSGSLNGDSLGRFAFPFRTGAPVQVGSATMTVTPRPGLGLVGRDTSGIPVRILPTDPPTESTFVRLTLRARQ